MTWQEQLRAIGVTEQELANAHTPEEMLLLVMEHSLTDAPGRYTELELAGMVGIDPGYARRLFRALGIPDAAADDPVFTDDDAEALSLVERMRTEGVIDDDILLQMTRVVGSSLDRVAEAMVSAAVERVRRGGVPLGPGGGGIVDRFPQILELVWRRQMRSAVRRRMALHEHEEAATVAVGFADLVGFTALSQQLPDDELAATVDRFESTAYDIVGRLGGRVVKTIGDEVMYAVPDPRAAVEIGLELSDTYHDDASLSDVRVGLARGPVLAREGDLFGPTVNMAHRIVSIAYAGSVVVSEEIHDAVADDPALIWRPLRTRYLKDIGRVRLWVVRHAADGFEREGTLERARRRQGDMRNRMAEAVADLIAPSDPQD